MSPVLLILLLEALIIVPVLMTRILLRRDQARKALPYAKPRWRLPASCRPCAAWAI